MAKVVLAAATLTVMVLVTLHFWVDVACGVRLEREETATLSSLNAKRADVMLVSEKHWTEPHAFFARLFEGTVTTWRIPNKGLRSYFLENRMQGERTVVVDVNPNSRLDSMSFTLKSAGLTRVCVSWVYAVFKPINWTYFISSGSPPTACQVAFILQMNGTSIKKIVWPHTLEASRNPSKEEIRSKLRIESPNLKLLSGQRLTVGCLLGTYYGGGRDSCDHHVLQFFLQCLRQRNVSLTFLYVPTSGSVRRGTAHDNWDVVFLSSRLNEQNVLDSDIPHVEVIQESFFSRINDDRVVTLTEVVYKSWPLFASTFVVPLGVALVLVKMEDHRRPPIQRILDTVTLLLAAILATSTSQLKNVSRRAIAGVALYFLWFLAMLPLSSYFRSELTSKVTVKAPGDRIDTLEKLADALDRHEVAPCATLNSALEEELKQSTAPAGSLMSKLQAAFKRHDPKELVRYDIIDCLRCAMRRDRVCYDTLAHSCESRYHVRDVRVFNEHYRPHLSGFQMRKGLAMYRPLRRFFNAIREGQVLRDDHSDCSHLKVSDPVQFDLFGFFVQFWMIQILLSCVVFLAEILVSRCSQHTLCPFVRAVESKERVFQ